jgi:hypothetical protein
MELRLLEARQKRAGRLDPLRTVATPLCCGALVNHSRDLPRRARITLQKEQVRLKRRQSVELTEHPPALSTRSDLRVALEEQIYLREEASADATCVQVFQELSVATRGEPADLAAVSGCSSMFV